MQNYQQIQTKSECPVCHSNRAHRLWSTTSRQAAQHFVLREKYPERFSDLVSHIELIWKQDTCEVVQCDKCRFCYCNPYVAGDAKFYSLAYDRDRYPPWKWEFQLTYDVLKKSSRKGIRLLDIGAGDGAFEKKIAVDILPKENILCTEFSEYGRHEIEQFGVNCLSDDIRNLTGAELNKHFDVICMFQVLEHLDGLDVLFRKLNWLMKAGASLFIAVPNATRIEFNELNGALLDMPPNHLGRWNKKCFKEIGDQNGFHIEGYQIEEDSFLSMAKQFMTNRLLQQSQKRDSLENHIFKIKRPKLRKALQVIDLAVNLPSTIPGLFKINSTLGNSQWVHFVKSPGQ